MSGFPTVKVYLPEVTRNPYTGKSIKTPLDYSGPRTAKGVVDFLTNKLPSKASLILESFASPNSATPYHTSPSRCVCFTPALPSISNPLPSHLRSSR